MPDKPWKNDTDRPVWNTINTREIDTGRNRKVTVILDQAEINDQTVESITIDSNGYKVHFPRRNAKEVAKAILEVAGE